MTKSPMINCSRPISSLEEKLMSLRDSISNDNTPIKKQ